MAGTLNDPAAAAVVPRELAEVLVALAAGSTSGGEARRMHLLATACTDLLGAAGAGVLLQLPNGGTSVVAAWPGPVSGLLELERDRDGGPGTDACRSGATVQELDLAAAADRWPVLAPAACEAGLPSVLSLPFSDHQGETLGSLTMFGRGAGTPPTAELALAQSLVEAATAGVLHARSVERVAQLQQALDSRVVIEQAKGMLAQHHGVDIGKAWLLLRRHARDSNRRVNDVAADLVSRSLLPEAVHHPVA